MTCRPPQRRLLVAVIVFALSVFAAAADAASLDEQVAGYLQKSLEAGSTLRLGSRVLTLHPDLPRFYRERGFRPAWMAEQGPIPRAAVLVETLRNAEREGLCSEDYHLEMVESLQQVASDARVHELVLDPVWMSHLELLLTDAVLRYASHLLQGRLGSELQRLEWYTYPRQADLARLLAYAHERDRLGPVLADLLPPHPGYHRLRDLLERYRQLSARGGWPVIPPGPTLRQGDRDPRLALIKARLFMEGDLPHASSEESSVFDPATVAALSRFQGRHGLAADGVFGAETRAAFNLPVEARIRQIEINLERWRWLPKSFGRRHLLVNIADFRLHLVEDGREVLSMPVVVGSAYRQTPIFSGRMSYLDFAPSWVVPPTILREDLLPKFKRTPSLLARQGYEIVQREGSGEALLDPDEVDWETVEAETFPGLLRQKPGPLNPLGRVKFIFPNRFDVYLHDTPERRHFGRDVRMFSSGCIRIERPEVLAEWLLVAGGRVECDRLLDLLEAMETERVLLREGIPVHLQYWTAWVEPDGTVQFRDDVYLRDLDLELAWMEGVRSGL